VAQRDARQISRYDIRHAGLLAFGVAIYQLSGMGPHQHGGSANKVRAEDAADLKGFGAATLSELV
jgi:hypothetical protein